MKFLMEHEIKEILENHGIRTARCRDAESKDEAVDAAKETGLPATPVVMKVASRKIVHKSDVGGDVLRIRSEEEVRRAFRRLMVIDGAEGVNVQPMLEKGIEAIVGVSENPQFGSVIMFGLGGVFVKLLRDVSIRLLPLTRRDAAEMIREVRGHRLIEGFRGYRGDFDALVDLLLRVSRVVEEESIIEMDLNPVFVYETGYAVADARAVVGKRKSFGRKHSRDELYRVLIVTSSGGSGILTIDVLERNGLRVFEADERLKAKLRELVPAHAILDNPIDLTGDATAGMYLEVVKAAFDYADAFLLIFGDPIEGAANTVMEVVKMADRAGKSVVVAFLGGAEVEREEVARMHRHGIPVFPTPERAARVLTALKRWGDVSEE